MTINVKKVLQLITAALLILAGLWLYLGNGQVLSQQEVDDYIKDIEAQAGNPGRHDIAALRHFLEQDDGQPFYTVNLYQFHQQAHYPTGVSQQQTGRQAFNKFTAVMVPLLVQHASHPIFGSDWADSHLNPWDRLVIVRYRSRRDIADIFSSAKFAQASVHKWAGLDKNQRLLMQGLHIPELTSFFIMLLILLLILIGLRLGKRKS
jgi:hypothetical protein